MKIIIANDHAAVDFASKFNEELTRKGHYVTWLGVKEEISSDYPDKALEACNLLKKDNQYDFVLLLCGTGIGMSIAANKIKGMRCALLCSSFSATFAKKHNNANVVAMGARVKYAENPYLILQAYMDEFFEGGRHQRRLDKLADLETTL